MMWYFNPNSYPAIPRPATVIKETAKMFIIQCGSLKNHGEMDSGQYHVNKTSGHLSSSREEAYSVYEAYMEQKIEYITKQLNSYKTEFVEIKKLVEEYP